MGWAVGTESRAGLRGISFDLDFCGAEDFVLETKALSEDARDLLVFAVVVGGDFL